MTPAGAGNQLRDHLNPPGDMTRFIRLPHLAAALPAFALLGFAPLAAHAQASPLAGKWTIEYAGGMRIENDTPTPIMAKARLNMNGEERIATAISTWTLSAEGDALRGTLERRIDGMDLPVPPAQPVTGTRTP